MAAYIITRHGDKVGALAFSAVEGTTLVPPRTGRLQALRIVHVLSNHPTGQGGGRTDLAAVLHQMARIARRRSLVFLVSDFHAPEGWEGPLQQLTLRHEVIAVRVEDPRERELPDVGGVHLEDPETGEQVWIDTSDRRVRETYRELVAARDARLSEVMRRAGVDMLSLSTGSSLVEPLLKFVTLRRRRRWNSPGR